MNELADRLERLMDRVRLAPDLDGTFWKEHVSGRLLEEREAILNAVRFAGYMERLAEYKALVRKTYDYETKHGTHCVNIHFPSGIAKSFYGSDIYTAARKAVEALKKGD